MPPADRKRLEELAAEVEVILPIASVGSGDPGNLREDFHAEINEALDRLTEQRT